MNREGGGLGPWAEIYRRRAALDPLRAVLDEGDPDNRKNVYVDALDRFWLRRALGPRRYGAAVDLGCGVGRLTGLLAGRSRLTIGVDASEALLAAAALRSGRSAGLVRGALGALPLPAGRSDLVVCWQVLLHLVGDSDMAAAIGEVRRLLAPGGRAVFAEHFAPGAETLRREGVVYRSAPDVLGALRAAGLRVESAFAIRKSPSRLVHLVRRGRLPRPLWPLSARLERLLAFAGRAPPLYRDWLVVGRPST
ncbi:MAG: class I SAM-dependent methyltransferase [Planctomycetes bacterium]|jgi:SAM-dependent methyltransferase|nr:class I SAM-dependent methyltransferase [Planctomycetota bacterium]